MKTVIIPTSTAEYLANNIKKKTKDFKVVFPKKNKDKQRNFPDGEVYMKLPLASFLGPSNQSNRIIILHSGMPKPNDGLIELELILQILKENRKKPEIFFTYFPYGMQDKVFERGETNVAESLIKKLINHYRVKKIYVIDPHFGGRKWVQKYPIISASAVPLLIKRAEQDFRKDILFLSPDKGGKRRTGILGIKKERLDSFKVKYVSPKIFLKDKIVGVVDDIIETGGTLLKFYDLLKKSGAKKIIVLASQGALSTGIAKIKKKYSRLYLTNAVKQKEANVDITDLILKTISS